MTTTLTNSLLILLIICPAVSCSLTWVSWPFTIQSQPQEVLVTYLYFSDTTMQKNSTFSLYFEIYVIGEIYNWVGPKNMVLDTGRILHGTWNYSMKGSYEKNQIIRVQWTVHTGSSTESYKVIFTDNSNQLKLAFLLPPYRSSNLTNKKDAQEILIGFNEIKESNKQSFDQNKLIQQ